MKVKIIKIENKGKSPLMIVLLASFILFSCSHKILKWYTGPAMPREQVAILFCDRYVGIVAVNGQNIYDYESKRGYAHRHSKEDPNPPSIKTIEVLPGVYMIKVKCFSDDGLWRIWGKNLVSIEFDAKPGKVYALRGNVNIIADTWRPEIEDMTDKWGRKKVDNFIKKGFAVGIEQD